VGKPQTSTPRKTLWWFSGAPQLSQQLDDVELNVIDAIEAAQAAGDDSEAELQESVLDELEQSAQRVSTASATAEKYMAAASKAADYGDFTEASENEELAYEAEDELESAEAELEELIAQAREFSQMSLYERMDFMPLANTAGGVSANDVASAVGTSLSLAMASVHTRLDDAMGWAPPLVWVLELLTFLFPLGCLGATYAVLRQGAADMFHPRSEAILFSHLYWAYYFSFLAITSFIMSDEPPLTAFARAQPREYTVYQVIVLFMYLAYTSLLGRHWFVVRARSAAAQFAGALLLFVFIYAAIFYPAVAASMPPTCSPFLYVIYAGWFTWLTALVRRERAGKGV
jgi:hypothetical protein